MKKELRERFAGIDRLYGSGAVERHAGSRVAVVGMGGVGSWVVEALARSGVGHLTLIDADDICISNTNRQLPALEGQYGRNKSEAMADRWKVVPLLLEGVPYREIHDRTLVSVTTIGRVARVLERGAGGYGLAIEHLQRPDRRRA